MRTTHGLHRSAATLLAATLAASLLTSVVSPAEAATAPVKRFANCTAMHKVGAYLGGIRRAGAHDRRASGVAQYRPFTSTARYRLNAFSDRDNDGVACEQ